MRKSVLAIGLSPGAADLASMPNVTPAMMGAYFEAQMAKLRDLGLDAELCLLDPADANAIAQLDSKLQSRIFECVVIGAGLRLPQTKLPLLEMVVNAVHAKAKHAKFSFNTTAADRVEAVRRSI